MPAQRADLVDAVSEALAELQAAYDDRDRALSEVLGVNRTDLRCLDLIVRHGPRTASELGAELHLTRGSMTTLVDRLERAGYARRYDDPRHGKRKLIAPTPKLVEIITPLFDEIRRRGQARLKRYRVAELRLILEFLQATLDAQEANTTAVRDWRDV